MCRNTGFKQIEHMQNNKNKKKTLQDSNVDLTCQHYEWSFGVSNYSIQPYLIITLCLKQLTVSSFH